MSRTSEVKWKVITAGLAFSLTLHIHLCVDKFMLYVVTVTASNIPCVCLHVFFCLIITFACVCVSKCVQNSRWICQTSKRSPPLSLMNELFRCLSWPAFQPRGFTQKKTSRDGGINGIKRRKRKQSGINIANRNIFWVPWGLWQWKKWALSLPVSVCVCTYLSICSVFYIISTCAGVCVCGMCYIFWAIKLILSYRCHSFKCQSLNHCKYNANQLKAQYPNT